VLVGLGLAGLAALPVAADQMVLGAARLAAMLRISPVLVGVLVIGLGTSVPEFLVSGLAAASGRGGLALGNLIGSNIVNVTLILGVAALLAPVAVRSSVVAREAPLALLAVTVFGGFAWWGLGLPAGLVLAGLLVAAVVLLLRLARVAPPDPLPHEVADRIGAPTRSPTGEGWRALLGLAGTLGAAQLVVVSAGGVAHRWGVPDVVIGATVVAVGTSLPELVTAVQAQRRGESDLLVGNVLGSNLFNSLAGGAVVGVAAHGGTFHVGFPVVATMVAVNLLAWLVLFRGYRVSRVEGAVLLGAYLVALPLLG
jgi:cation:H+ antiporter